MYSVYKSELVYIHVHIFIRVYIHMLSCTGTYSCMCGQIVLLTPVLACFNPLSTDGHCSGHLAKLSLFCRIGKFNTCTFTTLIFYMC